MKKDIRKEISVAGTITTILCVVGAVLMLLVNAFGMTSLIDEMRVILFAAFISISYVHGCVHGYKGGFDKGYGFASKLFGIDY